MKKLMPEFGRKECLMDTIYNIYVLWQGEERKFENVIDVKYGENYISFTDKEKHRFFSNVAFEVESYLADKVVNIPKL